MIISLFVDHFKDEAPCFILKSMNEFLQVVKPSDQENPSSLLASIASS
tara:strand:+ start:392 stop:535 length:144 start_codon:yes stop_codon:yes gene_type:complete